MKSTPILPFSVKRLFLLTLVCSIAVAALLGIVASANRANRNARARADAAKLKSSINLDQNPSDKQGPLAPSAATITATLTDNVGVATKVAPGETINYTAVITNGGAASPGDDATSVQYSPTIDANTTLVANSAHASPIAINEAYTTVGNTLLEAGLAVPSGNPSVISAVKLFTNDTIATAPDTIVFVSNTNGPNGATVTVNADGSFTYLPAAGFTGIDTFTYTIRNSADATLTNTGTVTVTVGAPRVWYVNNSGANGDGRSTSPFNTLAGAAAVDAASDIIYIFTGTGNYTGGVTLLNNEQVIGNGVALVVNTFTLRAAGSRPTVVNGAGNGFTLGSGNTLTGFNFGNCTGGFAFQGGGVGTLAVNNMLINTNGGAFDITAALSSVNIILDSTTSSGGAQNVRLVTTNGTVTLGSGALSGATANGLDVSGGAAAVTFTGAISNSGAKQVNVANMTSGSITLDGAVGGTGTGINLATNGTATFTFRGGVVLSTGASNAFSATGGGTVNVCDENPCNAGATGALVNTLTTTTGTALNVANTTIGANNLEFKTISAGTGASGPASGIILNTTGATGSLIVKGDGNTSVGGNSSGGTIQHTTQYGITMTNTQSPSFTNMNIHDIARNGVDGGTGVVNFTFKNSTIAITGTAAVGQYEDNGIALVDHAAPFDTATITGTVSITQNSISQPRRIGIALETWSGTISNLTITNNTISGGTTTSNISHGIEVLTQGVAATNANLTMATIQNNTISGFRFFDVPNNFYIGGSGIFLAGGNTGNTNSENFGVLATPIVVDNNSISNMGDSFIKFTFNGRAGQSYVNITNNGAATSPTGTAMTNCEGVGMSVFMGGGADAGHPFIGKATVDANRMVLNNRAGSSGLGVQMDNGGNVADIPSVQFAVSNNVVSNSAGSGIAAIGINNNGTMNLRVQNNNVTTAPTTANAYGIRVSQNSAGPVFCAKILGNTSFGSSGAPGIGYRRNTGNVFGIDGMAATASPGVDQYISGQNPGSQLASGIFQNPADSLYYRAYPISQSTGFTNCTSTAMHNTETNQRDYLAQSVNDFQNIEANSSRAVLANSATATGPAEELKLLTAIARFQILPTLGNPQTRSLNDIARQEEDEGKTNSLVSAFTQGPLVSTVVAGPGESNRSNRTSKLETRKSAVRDVLSHHAVRSNFNSSPSQNAPDANLPVAVGTLPAQKSVTIKYQVTVNTTMLTARQATSQGTVTANGGAISVLTDDPEIGGTQATVTQLDTTLTWTGATDASWSVPGNWTIPTLPTATVSTYAPGISNPGVNDVVIPNSGVTFEPTLNPATVSVFSLDLQSARTLTINSGSTLTVNSGLTTLAGALAGGPYTLNFAALTINRPTGITLNGPTSVSGQLTLTSGNVTTGANVLTLGSASPVISRTSGHIIGSLKKINVPAANFVFTVGTAIGYTPVDITSASGGGDLTVETVDLPQPTLEANNPGRSLTEYWKLTEGGTVTASMVFHYLQSDVPNVADEVNYRIIRVVGTSTASFPLNCPSISCVNPATDTFTISGVSNFSDWTVGAVLAPTASNGIVTGRIVDSNGAPVEGTVVRLEGTQNRKFITDANGVYRFENVETNGFYTVTPSRANYIFNPSVRSFSQIGETTEAAFGATVATSGLVNPLDTPEYFVRQHYLDFLGREPDEAGFNYWSDQIIGCGLDQDCIERKRENVSAAYFLSIEFQQTGGLVDGLYRASYGVRPNFAEFMPDTRVVAQGVVVGRDGWQSQLQANKEAFVAAFVNRPAFVGVYGNMDNSLFVDTLISHTGVSFTSSEREALVSGLTQGTMTRAEALSTIAENEHFVSAKFNDAFVMMEYFGYLRRDADAAGFQFWLDKLNQFGGNFEQAQMVKAFIVSGEYRDRFPK